MPAIKVIEPLLVAGLMFYLCVGLFGFKLLCWTRIQDCDWLVLLTYWSFMQMSKVGKLFVLV